MVREQIEENLELIQTTVDIKATIDSPECILDKLNQCTNLLGLSAEVYAWSEKLYNDKLGELILAKEYKGLNATDKKILFASLASEQIMLHSKAERLNKALVHAIDSLRSMLSFIKEELKKTY